MSKELADGIREVLEIAIKESPEKLDETVKTLTKGIDDNDLYVACVRNMASCIKDMYQGT